MAPLSRRDLVTRLLGLGMLAAGAAVFKRVFFPGRLGAGGLRTFEALLDTLLPGGVTPSWRATDVMPRLLDELERERKTRRAVAEGVGWLDAEARRRFGARFEALPGERRPEVVAAAAAHPVGSLPRFFYRVVRDRAMRLHFAHPAAARAVGLPHAPQPDGWWDFEDAPRA